MIIPYYILSSEEIPRLKSGCICWRISTPVLVVIIASVPLLFDAHCLLARKRRLNEKPFENESNERTPLSKHSM